MWESCSFCTIFYGFFRILKMASPAQAPTSHAVIALIGIAAILGNALVLWIFVPKTK